MDLTPLDVASQEMRVNLSLQGQKLKLKLVLTALACEVFLARRGSSAPSLRACLSLPPTFEKVDRNLTLVTPSSWSQRHFQARTQLVVSL